MLTALLLLLNIQFFLAVSRDTPINPKAINQVLYEVQIRSANACHPQVGSADQQQACVAKIAPNITYRAQGTSCSYFNYLKEIKLGTIEDMLEDTSDYRKGITLRYIKEKVGAPVVWIMPPFPNNDIWDIPDACDNLGSPYAVRDFMHIRGSLGQRCSLLNLDEYSQPSPCWATDSFDKLIQKANSLGLDIWLDIPFNHFGHNYQMYDYSKFTSVRTRIARGENLNNLWNFDATFDPEYLYPTILDDPKADLSHILNTSDYMSFVRKCGTPSTITDFFLRQFNMWRVALDWERNQFDCRTWSLEGGAPGFFLGRDAVNPSTGGSDFFNAPWRDTMFLFEHEENTAHTWEFVRNREYLFRAMNYWVSKGVKGFRLDHTTDYNSGIMPNEWKYITLKLEYYAAKRGQPRPVFLAEEFMLQQEMAPVVDIETEGYLTDMTGRNGQIKDANYVHKVLANTERFMGQTLVMTALETHDEKRLMDGTGMNIWTGAGFWGLGNTIWATPMLLMGQEFGEKWQLSFKRNDFLRSRFVGTSQYEPNGDDLRSFYQSMIRARLSDNNYGLRSQNNYIFVPKDPSNVSIYGVMKWTNMGNVMFAFHNLWEVDSASAFFIPPDVANLAFIGDNTSYRLVDVLSNSPLPGCRLGKDLKWEILVIMPKGVRVQWLRLELCR